MSFTTNRFNHVLLNPQPLPPGGTIGALFSNRFVPVLLNPQPLPPRDGGPVILRGSFSR